MTAALDMDSITLDPSYQPPAIMAVPDSASAFPVVKPVVVYRRPAYRVSVPDEGKQAVTLTDRLVNIFDPSLAMSHELRKKAERYQLELQSYQIRIDALRADAGQDGYTLNAASERDFWRFVRSEPFTHRGNLVLMDNGNLRAVWKGQHGTHVGLQFLGGRTVQYVIFKQRAATDAISRVAGRDSIDGVKRQIMAFDLRPLIYA